jgi:hypothetical protein
MCVSMLSAGERFSLFFSWAPLVVSLASLCFAIYAWRKTQAIETKREKGRVGNRWHEKLTRTFLEDAAESNRARNTDSAAPLRVESGSLCREFRSTVEVLMQLPQDLEQEWKPLLAEAIRFAGSESVLWWEVYLYADKAHPDRRRLPLRLGQRDMIA